jgi:hypothetical protein
MYSRAKLPQVCALQPEEPGLVLRISELPSVHHHPVNHPERRDPVARSAVDERRPDLSISYSRQERIDRLLLRIGGAKWDRKVTETQPSSFRDFGRLVVFRQLAQVDESGGTLPS